MRLKLILEKREQQSGKIQDLPTPTPETVVQPIEVSAKAPMGYRIKRHLAPLVLPSLQPWIRRRLGTPLPLDYDALTIGDRWASEALQLEIERRVPKIEKALIQGCSPTDPLISVLMRGSAEEVVGIDLNSPELSWKAASQKYFDTFGKRVSFLQANMEDVPLPNDSFDFTCSTATLEHVKNLDAAAKETKRLLRPGGWTWHSIGPLYFTHGGDHCISAYGLEAGYDHLLCEEADYQSKINDMAYFAKHADDPFCSWWAKSEQFSLLFPSEYLEVFSRHLKLEYVLVVLSPEGLRFRKNRPDLWRKLVEAGLTPSQLLVKSLNFLARKV